MSVPLPLVRCHTIDDHKAVVRALWALGYRSMAGRTFDQQIDRMTNQAHAYVASTYAGVYCPSHGGPPKHFGWESRIDDNHTLVNSVSHMRAYLIRHGLVLTPGAAPSIVIP